MSVQGEDGVEGVKSVSVWRVCMWRLYRSTVDADAGGAFLGLAVLVFAFHGFLQEYQPRCDQPRYNHNID